ncbi:hypothetical protein, partial [Enterococcus faecalis]|uniref:hypothetical protein n=1 Tax=Enterococcus faecalis TaxID=1351 RepID=UPI003D6B3AAE
ACEEISRLKIHSFFYKQVRDIYETVTKKLKNKKRSERNSSLTLCLQRSLRTLAKIKINTVDKVTHLVKLYLLV